MLPASCIGLTPWLTCSKCNDGHRFEKGRCVPCGDGCVTCPGRQFPNNQGACTPVSSECDGFDPRTGLCTSCLSGASPVSGVCCPSGQQVQGGVCVTINVSSTSPGGAVPISFLESAFFDNCQIIDLQTQTCTQCKPGRRFLSGVGSLCV